MNEPSDTADVGNTVTVLSVSTAPQDHDALEQAVRESEVTLYPNNMLTLRRCTSVEEALAVLHESRIPIVVYEGDMLPGAWREIIAGVKDLPAPPCLIVTSKEADDHMWAEALSHGAFDVIPKPFQKAEVIRIISAAWRRWRLRYGEMAATAESKPPAES